MDGLLGRLASIQDWLFPGTCVLCAARINRARDFCPRCEVSLPWLGRACRRCAVPLETGDRTPRVCGACQRRPPAFTRTRALFRYAPPIDHLIHGLKYHGRLDLARSLGELLADELEKSTLQIDVIVPVPLHRTRLRARGYNQALELARPLAARLGLRLDYACVERARATAPQATLAPKARQRNVRQAFSAAGRLDGLRLALVDDVMTTGHTANAVATCLRRAGARQVELWVVARA